MKYIVFSVLLLSNYSLFASDENQDIASRLPQEIKKKILMEPVLSAKDCSNFMATNKTNEALRECLLEEKLDYLQMISNQKIAHILSIG